MSGFCLLLLFICGHKVIIPFPLKCKHCVYKSKKQLDLISASATAFDFLFVDFATLELTFAGSAAFRPLSISLIDFGLAVFTSFLDAADLVTANVSSENLIKNSVEFCNLGQYC